MTPRPSPAALVREFHEAFGLPVRTCPDVDVPEKAMRASLIMEEAREVLGAINVAITAEAAHELADLVYVCYGAALTFGIDLDAVLVEVHRANMSKLGADGRPLYRGDGKVLKGPGFVAADVAAVLAQQAA